MKSPFTGKEMKIVKEERILPFRKEDYIITHHAYRCEETGEQFTTTELDELNMVQVYNQYREKHHIPFTEEIKQVRKKYEVSAARMSEILGLGANSYRNYEDGEVPQLSNARLIQNVDSPAVFRNMVELCDSLDSKARKKINARIDHLTESDQENAFDQNVQQYMLGKPNPEAITGFKTPSLEKFSGMVVFFAEKLQPYKTKLNKLLFYADFAHFGKTGFSISGIRYRAIDLGPVPDNFQTIYEYLQSNKHIEIKYQAFDNGTGEKFLPVGNFDDSIFTELELSTLQDVADKFTSANTHDIIEWSHEELAWKEPFKTKALIPYTYGFTLKHI